MEGSDSTLGNLLALDGEVIVIHDQGYWVKFSVRQVDASSERPHGLDYALTMHAPDGKRIVGFDNAHPVPPSRLGEPRDHRHHESKAKPYEYTDAADLLEDFWIAVDEALHARGIMP